MAYGLQCWDRNGNIILDTESNYCRLLYSTITSSNGSVTLEELEGHQSVQWGETLGEYSFGPVVTRSNNTIEWETRTSEASLILVFVYT